MKARARQLRKGQTDAEKCLWRHLRNRQLENYKFRRQYVIGSSIVDFVSLDAKLIVEVDGGQHAERRTADIKRTDYLMKQGYRVLRFWNHDVLTGTHAVLETIRLELISHSPQPSSCEGEGG